MHAGGTGYLGMHGQGGPGTATGAAQAAAATAAAQAASTAKPKKSNGLRRGKWTSEVGPTFLPRVIRECWFSCFDFIGSPRREMCAMKSGGRYRYHRGANAFPTHVFRQLRRFWRRIIRRWKLVPEICQLTGSFDPIRSLFSRLSVFINAGTSPGFTVLPRTVLQVVEPRLRTCTTCLASISGLPALSCRFIFQELLE